MWITPSFLQIHPGHGTLEFSLTLQNLPKYPYTFVTKLPPWSKDSRTGYAGTSSAVGGGETVASFPEHEHLISLEDLETF